MEAFQVQFSREQPDEDNVISIYQLGDMNVLIPQGAYNTQLFFRMETVTALPLPSEDWRT